MEGVFSNQYQIQEFVEKFFCFFFTSKRMEFYSKCIKELPDMLQIVGNIQLNKMQL